jgi:hypothetical protein
MSNPVRLTDDELSAVMLACQPLAPEARDGFLPPACRRAARSAPAASIAPSSSPSARSSTRPSSRARPAAQNIGEEKGRNPIISKRGRDYDLARLDRDGHAAADRHAGSLARDVFCVV